MKRNAEREMERWADAPVRKPLVLRGARQVGKTWLLKEFGRRRFGKVAYFSFDREDAPHAAFANKNPRRIVEILEILGIATGPHQHQSDGAQQGQILFHIGYFT